MAAPASLVAPLVLAAILALAPSCKAGAVQKLPCTKFHTVAPSDTCDSITAAANILPGDFANLNPSLALSCSTLHSLKEVCILGTPYTCGIKGYVDHGGPFTGPETQFVGRTSSLMGGTRFGWAANQAIGRFSDATTVTLFMRPVREGTNFTDQALNLYVDDALCVSRLGLADGTTSFTILLADRGIHSVVLMKIVDSLGGDIVFDRFATDGVALPTRAPSQRYMEFLGDSVTVGSGVTPDLQHPCFPFAGNIKFEDVTLTAGFLAATAFRADISVPAVSGRGVCWAGGMRTENTSYIYTLASPRSDLIYKAVRQADVVVAALGMTDMGGVNTTGPNVTYNNVTTPAVTQHEFQGMYLKLVGEIRKNYPRAWVILAVGPMLHHSSPPSNDHLLIWETWVKGVIANLTGTPTGTNAKPGKDQKIRYLEYLPVPAANKTFSFTGCGTHPNSWYHKFYSGPLLISFVKQLTGWA